jgi:hypothetical protein
VAPIISKEHGVFTFKGQAVQEQPTWEFFLDCLTHENEGNTFLKNIRNHTPNNAMPHICEDLNPE